MVSGLIDPAFSRNEVLSRRLKNVIRNRGGAVKPPNIEVACPSGDVETARGPVDVVITPNEINDRHGTGPLIKRILRGRSNLFCIRSKNDWGMHDFGDWNVCVPQKAATRPESFRRILGALEGREVRSVVCIPFLSDELISSIAIQASFGARLCAWIMDDQNVACRTIPDELMREFLERCNLRLATHPELRRAYERKYGLPFHLLPAIVPEHLIGVTSGEVIFREARGALLGSFWDQAWFDNTCAALTGSGYEIDWHGNHRSPWLTFPEEMLSRAGIRPLGVTPEEQLGTKLSRYPFVIVPAGTLDADETNKGVALLSLPGRILFAIATSNTPVLVLGSEQTCAARFVRHFGVGEVAPYKREQVRKTMERMRNPENQERYRTNAAAIAGRLSDRGVAEWLASSLELGAPADRRFEDFFAQQ